MKMLIVLILWMFIGQMTIEICAKLCTVMFLNRDVDDVRTAFDEAERDMEKKITNSNCADTREHDSRPTGKFHKVYLESITCIFWPVFILVICYLSVKASDKLS